MRKREEQRRGKLSEGVLFLLTDLEMLQDRFNKYVSLTGEYVSEYVE